MRRRTREEIIILCGALIKIIPKKGKKKFFRRFKKKNMKLKKYVALRIRVFYTENEDMIQTSGEEFGISWNRDNWGDGLSF